MDIELLKQCRDELIAVRGFYRGITEEYEKKVKLGMIGGTKKASNIEYLNAIRFGIVLLNYFIIGEQGNRAFEDFQLKFTFNIKDGKKAYQKLIQECQDEFARCELLPTDSMYYKALLTVLLLIRKIG